MQKQIWAIIILIVLFLASAIGGFFVVSNRQSPAGVELGQSLIIKEAPPVKEATESEDPGLKYIASEIERVAKVSAEVVAEAQKFIEEENEKKILINQALNKSSQVKGIYLNEFIANYQTPFAKASRENIKKMLQETELNGVVIDIKENNGPNLPDSLKAFIEELHQQDVWVIARICVFRDSSLREKKPEWYLKDSSATSSDNIWKDPAGASWLDASSTEVQAYIVDFSKKAIDFGFDELQFDYIRFPSDGKIKNIVYPFYDAKTEKYEVIGGFFSKLPRDLKEYKPSIILSADLFGYLATQFQSFDIGQRLLDAGKYFDYLSFMLYPSHFYGGFRVDYDEQRGLPALRLLYKDETTTSSLNLVSSNPYSVILRSVLSSVDYLSAYGLTTKVRPWLQDFNLSYDVSRGIIYDVERVKAQIQGAEDAGSAGWLLWNSANIYTEAALKKTGQ
ncbi:MAG: putative glycoside hydrolase [Patescibacteria group bacterium]